MYDTEKDKACDMACAAVRSAARSQSRRGVEEPEFDVAGGFHGGKSRTISDPVEPDWALDDESYGMGSSYEHRRRMK